ncbi:MAG: hypothetical protein ACI8W3_001275 [Myxococcota bacterium]|jgi:hypothetical protein
MTDLAVHLEFNSSPDAVWKELADFGAVGTWGPGIVSCKVEGDGIGSIRYIEMGGGVVMEERLESFDAAEQTLSYAIIGGPMPVENYLATVKVTAAGDGCRVDWGASFDAPEGVPADGIAAGVSGAYTGMLASLKAHLGES